MSLRKTFMNGIISENPTFRLVLGMCPTMAITTTVFNGIGMGLAATFVLVFSNLAISLLRKVTPEAIRIPTFVIAIATFVTIVQLVVEAFVPALHKSLGIFIPLIVVNCIIFARAEAYAFKNPPMHAVMDGLGMGAGFTMAITVLAGIREVLGNGTFFGMQVMPEAYKPMTIITSPPGGFIMLGLLLATVNLITQKFEKKKAAGKAAEA